MLCMYISVVALLLVRIVKVYSGVRTVYYSTSNYDNDVFINRLKFMFILSCLSKCLANKFISVRVWNI